MAWTPSVTSSSVLSVENDSVGEVTWPADDNCASRMAIRSWRARIWLWSDCNCRKVLFGGCKCLSMYSIR